VVREANLSPANGVLKLCYWACVSFCIRVFLSDLKKPGLLKKKNLESQTKWVFVGFLGGSTRVYVKNAELDWL